MEDMERRAIIGSLVSNLLDSGRDDLAYAMSKIPAGVSVGDSVRVWRDAFAELASICDSVARGMDRMLGDDANAKN